MRCVGDHTCITPGIDTQTDMEPGQPGGLIVKLSGGQSNHQQY